MAYADRMARRVIRPWTVAVAILLASSGLTLLVWPGPAPATDRPTLPTEFAAYSMFTAHAEDRPAGRAIALYEIGSREASHNGTSQALVAGADRDSYRQVHGGVGASSLIRRSLLLSPDGTQVIRRVAAGRPDELELLDLRTGGTTPRHGVAWTPGIRPLAGGTEDVAFLAWSPDGRYVAYATHWPHSGDGPLDPVVGADLATPMHTLVILDIIADQAREFPDIDGVLTAAFAPDSRRIALATFSGGIVVSVEGETLGTFADPTPLVPTSTTYEARPGVWEPSMPPYEPGPGSLGWPMGMGGLAWSPDGTTLAVTTRVFCGRSSGLTGGGPHMPVTGFVDMATGQPVSPQPPMPCLAPLGWRSPTTLVGEQIPAVGGYGIAEVSLVDGSVMPLGHFSYAVGCEIVSRCDIWRLQLATNLLSDAGVRDSFYPDRGPFVPIVHGGLIAVPILLVIWLAVLVVTSVRKRRRGKHQPPSAPADRQPVVVAS